MALIYENTDSEDHIDIAYKYGTNTKASSTIFVFSLNMENFVVSAPIDTSQMLLLI